MGGELGYVLFWLNTGFWRVLLFFLQRGVTLWRRNRLVKLYPDDELGGCLAGDPA
ncbi:hypothetical protein HmCmsJML019_03240 [Escherichia coli]|nr:hypothetical protein HmCmsJML019_03240 [Escherichia coli]